MRISELDTPALLIDLGIMERNLQRAAEYARANSLRLRPHTKTHKIPALARRQLSLGAAGLSVAKVGEAEVMLDSDTPDMLVAYPVIGSGKLRRLMDVARRTSVTVALDSAEAAVQLSAAAVEAGLTIGVLAELDAGLGRVGVQPGAELLELIHTIGRMPGLEFRGLAFYPGHIKAIDSAALDELSRLLDNVRSDLQRARIEAPIISGGSTPTLWRSHRVRGINEIRPGTYIFNDRNTLLSGACSIEDCAAHILVTVVSTSVRDQMIIDGGSKTFSSDRSAATGVEGYGIVREAPEAVFTKMNEEHGFVSLPGASGRFRVGDRLRVLPNHICVCMNLHERVYGIRGEEVIEIWPVAARGKLS
jgi:D-serine deaminase-like pyridoxal phosphate-dependent protein